MIKIVTVYNSLNPGSLLQAEALYIILKKKYNKVEFFDAGARHPYLSGIKLSLKLIKKLKFKYAFQQLIMPFKYNKILKNYSKTKKINDEDIFILGSDEIWNVSRLKIAKHRVFWGCGLNKENCISYAPSINNTKEKDINEYSFIKESLSKLHTISVRDNYSKRVLSKFTNNNIEIVCDPTLLLDNNYYKGIQSQKKNDNYIFVYGSPKRFTQDAIDDIKKFAKNTNKKLISYYFYNNWCDEIVYGSPYEFLSLISNADYVFTNTFHGTIFSIIYNKKFMAFGNDNKKVEEVLEQYGLNNNYSHNKNINKVLNSEFEYDRINKQIKQLRDKSIDYLYSNIDDIIAKNKGRY